MKDTFDFTGEDLKHYPHFDAPIALKEIRRLVTDPVRVASNSFYPFLRYEQSWQPYRSTGSIKPDQKIRAIRYGARRDAYIFAFYRRKLSCLYEARLLELGISDCPIAYRRIPKAGRRGGKCNIDFAKDAFDEIDRLGNCVAVALDIESYFERLDHDRIKSMWCSLLGVERLPPDHYAVFKSITKYRFVDKQKVYSRLGYYGLKLRNGRLRPGFLVPFREMPKKICSNSDFRAKICGDNPEYQPSLIQKNTLPHGIPQGSPISDLIANFYLIEFDREMDQYARIRGGRYMRYSDDIIIILPGGNKEAEESIDFATLEIKKQGVNLQIKDTKTCVGQFNRTEGGLLFQHLRQRAGEPIKNGFEYLGFRYDGRRVYVRDGTISRFYRKVSRAAKRHGRRHVENNRSLDAESLIASFNFSLLAQKFTKVKKSKRKNGYRNWTYYSYLKRSAETFGPKGDRIQRQARYFDKFMHERVCKSIESSAKRKRP